MSESAVEMAARALVAKLDRVLASGEYQAVWTLAAVHGQPYAGEDFGAEYLRLKEAIKEADKA